MKAVKYRILQLKRIWQADWLVWLSGILSLMSIIISLLSQPCTPLITNPLFYIVSSSTWTHVWKKLLHEVNWYLAKLWVTDFILEDGFDQFWSRKFSTSTLYSNFQSISRSVKKLIDFLSRQTIDWLFVQSKNQLFQFLNDQSIKISVH